MPTLLAGMRALAQFGPRRSVRPTTHLPRSRPSAARRFIPSFSTASAADPKLVNQPDGLHPNSEGVKIIVERYPRAPVEGVLAEIRP